MHSVEVTPAVNTRYGAYLQSDGWKRTRNKALARARWTCQRCGRKRNIQVHHRSYERLGFEVDADLEVVCRDCHEGEHLRQMHDADGNPRLYLKLANDVFRARPYDSFADLADTVKAECARLKIPYDRHQVDQAARGLLTGAEFGVKVTTSESAWQARVEDRPLTAQEAREAWKYITNVLGGDLIKQMPCAKPSPIDIYGPVPSEGVEHDRY